MRNKYDCCILLVKTVTINLYDICHYIFTDTYYYNHISSIMKVNISNLSVNKKSKVKSRISYMHIGVHILSFYYF